MSKMAVYLKGSQKPIIISDTNTDNLAKMVEQAENLFKSETIFKINTGTDCLIGRPSEIQSILISETNKGTTDATRHTR